MKLIFSQDCWILDELHPIEWEFLDRLPGLASGEGATEKALRRFKPDPLDAAAAEESDESEEIRADWLELVHPELDSAFSEARNQVVSDLRKAEQHEASNESPVPLTRVEVSDDHTESWYSTLNQARLLLNEIHDIADKTEKFYRDELNLENDANYLILLAQYEFYTAIQSDLIENRMLP